ncbi:uncharacterized protein PSFLO_03991 [Pseudozyma flocculosa]|uniref:Uncharacterized protein n=1 Tax=Pseudozyma flocculosa TaxID=84751 RepID=A0A5C3F1W6_9BASI|nr:uncharacterized protein PSFLO_03991 [Pseudozyma flocculosa]
MTLTEPPTSNLSSSLTVGRVFGDQRGARREGEREWSVDQRQLSEPPASECARGATTVRVRPSVRRTKDGRRHRFISRLGTRRRLRVDGYMNGRTGLAAIQPPSDVRRGTMERQCVATLAPRTSVRLVVRTGTGRARPDDTYRRARTMARGTDRVPKPRRILAEPRHRGTAVPYCSIEHPDFAVVAGSRKGCAAAQVPKTRLNPTDEVDAIEVGTGASRGQGILPSPRRGVIWSLLDESDEGLSS